jgi:hypothetical protein
VTERSDVPSDAPAWTVRAAEPIDTATAARAARSQASLTDALTRLRAVRFPLFPQPVEPSTGDRAHAVAEWATLGHDAREDAR